MATKTIKLVSEDAMSTAVANEKTRAMEAEKANSDRIDVGLYIDSEGYICLKEEAADE